MNFANKLDFILSIIYIVILVFVLWCVFICFGGGNMLLDSTGEVADSLPKDGNNSGAGYLLLGGCWISLFGGSFCCWWNCTCSTDSTGNNAD